MVPVGIIQFGWTVTAGFGATGATGSGFTATIDAAEIHPEVVFFTVRLKVVFGDNPEKVLLLWYALPLILYCRLAPSGAVIPTMPVGELHVGWVVTLAAGAAGTDNAGRIVTAVAEDMHPVTVFLTITL